MVDQLWEQLIATAIVGTERRELRVPESAGDLSATLAAAANADRETLLLHAAAAVSLYRRAGALPLVAGQLPAQELALDDQFDLPICSTVASQHLQHVLAEQQRSLLPEWFAIAAQAGTRIPPQLLPTVLDRGRNEPALRPAIRAVIGARGRWLAQQNPAWVYASVDQDQPPDNPTEVWQLGNRQLRLTLLHDLRQSQPALARHLIQTTWSEERAEERAAFLASLRVGLSHEDEPFLEQALDDRSKEVRTTAADLLSQLPSSRLVQRMRERVLPLIHWTPAEAAKLLGLRPARPARIDLVLPSECDKQLQHDGIQAKVPPQLRSLGERAYWISQMLEAIPPAFWCQHWRITPADILQAEGDWKELLLHVWINASKRYADQQWATALLRHYPNSDELLPILSTEQQERVLFDLIGQSANIDASVLFARLRETTTQWSIPLARAVIAVLQRHVRTPMQRYDYSLYQAFATFALRTPPELLPEIQRQFAGQLVHDEWRGAVDGWMITLQLRFDMRQAFAS